MAENPSTLISPVAVPFSIGISYTISKSPVGANGSVDRSTTTVEESVGLKNQLYSNYGKCTFNHIPQALWANLLRNWCRIGHIRCGIHLQQQRIERLGNHKISADHFKAIPLRLANLLVRCPTCSHNVLTNTRIYLLRPGVWLTNAS